MQRETIQALERDGFAVVENVFSTTQVGEMLAGLTEIIGQSGDESIRSIEGSVYAARNVLTLWPEVAHLEQQVPLPEILATILGAEFGLVRVLYFDKPPERSWALPWHKDLIIAVKNNRIPSSQFARPTTKVGVPHIEAPVTILENMLTARIHLDAVTEENGPLRVIPGSHQTGKELRMETSQPHTILADAGDVLLIRPLVAHCSNNSLPDTQQHRRILHLEFAGRRELPDGYAWHDYVAGATS